MLLVAAVGAAVGAVLWLTTLFGPPPRVVAPSGEELAPTARTAGDFAQAACVHLRLAGQAVQADAAAETVRRELAAGRVLAAEAFRRDPRFAGLSGGAAALDEAVRNDDADATAVGMRVVLKECEPLSR